MSSFLPPLHVLPFSLYIHQQLGQHSRGLPLASRLMTPLVEQSSTPGVKFGHELSGSCEGGVGAGTSPSTISMSAQLVHTWSASSQSHLQPKMYLPGLLGTLSSSMTE